MKDNIQQNVLQTLKVVLFAALATTQVQADPLPGRDLLKFSQRPMIATTVPNDAGVVNTYGGHDELSTAYRFDGQPVFQGRSMADDFADSLTSPVVHVKWWGSYLGNEGPQDPNSPVNRFLVSFESDVPQSPDGVFSHPGTPLLNQVVRRGPLAPGSGTFTEKLIRGPDPILGESLYEYNAELNLGKEFFEKSDTVYWLKIVALVDAPTGVTFDPFDPNSSPVAVTQWGWHNRDYTIKDVLASPNVAPGEFVEGFVGPANQPIPVYHFQDDAVSANVRIFPSTAGGLMMPNIEQGNYAPEHYKDFFDGPGIGVAGTEGIGAFSKDLAFELYTVPEPATCMLVLISLCGLATRRS